MSVCRERKSERKREIEREIHIIYLCMRVWRQRARERDIRIYICIYLCICVCVCGCVFVCVCVCIAGECELSLTSTGQRAVETIWIEPRTCTGMSVVVGLFCSLIGLFIGLF